MAAADPRTLVAQALALPDVVAALAHASAVDVVAVGKAAGPMLDAASTLIARPIRTRLGVGPQRPETLAAGTAWIVSGHPVPTEASVDAATQVLDVARQQHPDDLLLVLLSGGASALMALPAAGVTLADKQAAIRTLLTGGATINELNCVRKHLSAIKGGRLAQATAGATVTFALSDVVGDDLESIASGPTYWDSSTFGEAMDRGDKATMPTLGPSVAHERLN